MTSNTSNVYFRLDSQAGLIHCVAQDDLEIILQPPPPRIQGKVTGVTQFMEQWGLETTPDFLRGC